MKKDIPKYGANEVLQFVGLNKLAIEEQMTVNQLATKEFEKVERMLHNIVSMIVHIKEYAKEGGKNKYSLHVRVMAPTAIIESCKSQDWDLTRALRKSFEDIQNQIQHKFHSNATKLHIPHQKGGKRKREQNLMGSNQY